MVVDDRGVESEEGEWFDGMVLQMHLAMMSSSGNKISDGSNYQTMGIKEENGPHASSRLDLEQTERKLGVSEISDGNVKSDTSIKGQEESSSVLKHKEIKGAEASHALKCANNIGKKHKLG
ncbi:hypothetical protein Sjap_005024 [Stephania japonica]|uniref:Uncharacterized protein n=1 Tax=Stephania japonica TaxID=461633 RepID=A0AAP0PLF9_9MAGN